MTGPARPDVLALPTSTALRMVVVAVALVVSALFVGTALHNALLGQAWDEAVLGCLGPGDLLPTTEQLSCQAPPERRRAGVALLAAAVAVVLAAVVIAFAPAVVRRRRRLVPADLRFARAVQAVADLAAAAGVRAPGVLIVPGTAGEPFCVGRPGDYWIALPRKLALLGNPALFDALVGHEVAHLAHLAEAEREPVIQPHTVADDLHRVPEPLVRRHNGGHQPSPLPHCDQPADHPNCRQPHQVDDAFKPALDRQQAP